MYILYIYIYYIYVGPTVPQYLRVSPFLMAESPMSWRTPFELQRTVEVHPAAPQLYRRKDEILSAAAQASLGIVDRTGTRWAPRVMLVG